MSKFGRNAKILILLMAEQTQKLPRVNHLLDTMHGLTTLYNVRLANEKTIYSTYLQEPGEKLVIVFFNEAGLENRQFRECIRTSLAARINIISILDEDIQKERVMGFFNFNSKRKQSLLNTVGNAICLEKGVKLRAMLLVDRIQHICRPFSGFTRHKLPKINNEPVPIDLKACLNLTKVILKPVPHQPKPVFSCTLRKGTAFPPLHMSGSKSRTSPKLSQGSSRKNTSPKIVTCPRISPNFSQPRNKTPSKKSPSPVGRRIECPTIEISGEEGIQDEITAEQEHLPWSMTTGIAVPPFNGNKKNETNNEMDDLDVYKPGGRRVSFEYISKTYIVCDPACKKTLYVNFPNGAHVLRRDSASDILRSMHSRRNSLLYNGSVNSSLDDINLESVFDSINVFESPIPSPICRNNTFIYQNPLPVFPVETCFPPLETFPCDTLQMRRPSVFDVLLH